MNHEDENLFGCLVFGMLALAVVWIVVLIWAVISLVSWVTG